MSPRGGLWFSVILRPQVNPSESARLQILAAVSARRAVEQVSGTEVWLKWPNDLVLANGKVGGILVETKTVADVIRFAVLGIGINVNLPRKSLPEGAVSLLSATHRRTSLQKLLSLVMRELRLDYNRVRDPLELASEWWEHCIHKLKAVQVEGPQGVVKGMCTGLSSDGMLLVEAQPGQVVSVAEGTLRVLD